MKTIPMTQVYDAIISKFTDILFQSEIVYILKQSGLTKVRCRLCSLPKPIAALYI